MLEMCMHLSFATAQTWKDEGGILGQAKQKIMIEFGNFMIMRRAKSNSTIQQIWQWLAPESHIIFEKVNNRGFIADPLQKIAGSTVPYGYVSTVSRPVDTGGGGRGQCPPIICQTCFWRCYKRSLIWQQFWQQFILAIHAPPIPVQLSTGLTVSKLLAMRQSCRVFQKETGHRGLLCLQKYLS